MAGLPAQLEEVFTHVPATATDAGSRSSGLERLRANRLFALETMARTETDATAAAHLSRLVETARGLEPAQPDEDALAAFYLAANAVEDYARAQSISALESAGNRLRRDRLATTGILLALALMWGMAFLKLFLKTKTPARAGESEGIKATTGTATSISGENLALLFDHLQTGIAVCDAAGKYKQVNAQFSAMTGFGRNDLQGMGMYDLLVVDDREKYEAAMESLALGGQRSASMRLRFRTRDGRSLLTLVRQIGIYDQSGRLLESVASVLDVTDQEEASRKVMEGIIETENLERTRIATAIHDSVGQQLTSLHLLLTGLEKSEGLAERDAARLRQASAVCREALTETRNICHNLMPRYLARFGLIASIENLVEDLNGTVPGTEFSFYHNLGSDALTVTEQIAVYRIIQESINNILKYAQARQVDIQVVKHGNLVSVLVDDDGVGFEPVTARAGDSLGLKSLEFRARSIAADLEIDSQPGRGTTISLQIPVMQ